MTISPIDRQILIALVMSCQLVTFLDSSPPLLQNLRYLGMSLSGLLSSLKPLHSNVQSKTSDKRPTSTSKYNSI